ncbi:MAG: 50S ribosomal protein L25 [bacterium]
MQTLKAMKRGKADKLASMRNNGMIPAVVYGALVENTPISISSKEFEKVLKVAGESSSIVLDIDGGKKVDVLIHEVQDHPVRGYPMHVDFLAIDMNKPIQVNVPIEFTGVAAAEKSNTGTLVKVLHELHIEALPKNLPHSVSIDISGLAAVSDQVHVRDMIMPEGVTAITEADEVVALIAAMKSEKEEESAPVDLSAIEVEKKGKKEEDKAPEAE